MIMRHFLRLGRILQAVDMNSVMISGENSHHVDGLFEDAIEKNQHLQSIFNRKMLQIGAKIKELDRLKECVHKAKPMPLKPDACVQLVCVPKKRANARVDEDDSVPAMLKGPPENQHVACYKEALAMFPVGLRQMEWSKGERENLLKGLKQQFQAMLLNGSCEYFDDIDSIMHSIKGLQITPEKIRLFLPKVDWDRLAALYVPGHSGAECQSRYLNWEDPLINTNQWTAAEDKNLLRIVQEKGISNWLDIAVALRTKRTPFQCLARYQRSLNASILKREWTKEEDEQLRAAVETYGESNWQLVASVMEGRTGTQCSDRWLKTLHPARERVGRWTTEEDKRLTVAVMFFGPKKWKKVADCVPGRTQVQCRERWVNCLDPSINKGKWAQEEDSKLKAAIAKHGCLWTKVSACIPGRTDNQCWRRWKVLFPNEVHSRETSRKIQKTALISNFVGRKSERPVLGPTDFVSTDQVPVMTHEEGAGLEHDAAEKKASKLQPKRKRSKPSNQVTATTHEEGAVLGKHDAAKKKAFKLQPKRKRSKPSDQVTATTHEERAEISVGEEGSGLISATPNMISNLHPCRKRAKASAQVPETRYEEEMRSWYETILK